MNIDTVNIIYCTANHKYDLYIDGTWFGKYYTIESAIKGALGKVKRLGAI